MDFSTQVAQPSGLARIEADALVGELARRTDVARAVLTDGHLSVDLAGTADVAPLVSVIVPAEPPSVMPAVSVSEIMALVAA